MDEFGYVSEKLTVEETLVLHVESSLWRLCRKLSVSGSAVSSEAVRAAVASAFPSTSAADFASPAAFVACTLHEREDFLDVPEPSGSATGNFSNSGMTLQQAAAWTAALAVAEFYDESATYVAYNGSALISVRNILSELSTDQLDVHIAAIELGDLLLKQFRQPADRLTPQPADHGLTLSTDLRVVKSSTSLRSPRHSWFAAKKNYAANQAKQRYDKTPIPWRIGILVAASTLSFVAGAGLGYIVWV